MLVWGIWLLEGRNVRLKIVDREDLDFFVGFWNNLEFYGVWEPIMEQMSRAEAEKYLGDSSRRSCFLIQKNDGVNVGLMLRFGESSGAVTVGYAIMPSEHGKGYGTEALQLMIDYLFLAKQVHRIQANTDPENTVSQRLLEKAGFKREGVARKSSFVRGQWRDEYSYSILREEWKEPKILAQTNQN
jgi:ribosomal-protein-alanine N-acetyltransferase